MRHWWWKILAITLLLIASIAAFRVPLSPALVHVEPARIAPGIVVVTATGYNSRFTDEKQHASVYLENDGQRFCPEHVEIIDDRHVRITADVPAGLRTNLTDLVIGPLRYDGAFFTEGLGSGAVERICPTTDAHVEPAFTFPNRSILYESIRNLHFHVPMWFTMITLMGISMWKSMRVLGSNSLEYDLASVSAVNVGLVFCGLGLITGAVWARATWGTFWTNDVKLNGAAVTALIYLAYLVLRGSIPDAHKRARLAAIYNIFAFMLLIMFLFVVPRLNAVDSLHPGNGGNSGFSDLDLDQRLRLIFYPAVLGWILLGVWMYDLRYRTAQLKERLDL